MDQASLLLERGAGKAPQPAPPPSPLEKPAVDLCLLFRLPPAALRLLDDGPMVAEARRLLAYALDKRDAVWWAYLSAREAIRHREVPPEHLRALEAAREWVNDPTDANRARCKRMIAECGTTSMAGILCFAVWLSGGSISPTPLRHVEPRSHLCGKLCGVVVYLASVHFDAGRFKNYLRHFLSVGTAIARGECPWG